MIRDGSVGGSRRDFLAHGLARVAERAAALLAGRVAPAAHIRPPGALPEAAFVAACTRCGECARVCPVGAVLPLGEGAGLAMGTPVLAPATTACAMCADMPCARACPTDALTMPPDGWRGVALGRLLIDETRCITHRDVACGVCARVCPVGVEALRLDDGGHPVSGSACTGCGICIGACVTAPSSISILPVGTTT